MRVFPRPVSPKAAWRDLRSFLRTRTPHQFGFAAASIAIPLFLVSLFYLDGETMAYRPPTIVYVEKIDTSRSEAEIIAQQKIDAKEREAREKERQRILEENRRPFKELQKKMDDLGL